MRQLKFGCEEVEEERARVGGDAVVLCLWLNVEPVRARGDQSMRCAAPRSVHTAIRRAGGRVAASAPAPSSPASSAASPSQPFYQSNLRPNLPLTSDRAPLIWSTSMAVPYN